MLSKSQRWRVKEIEWQVKVCLSFNTSYYCRKAAKVFCCWLLLHNMFVFCLTLHFFLNWYLFNTFVHCSTFIWNCIKMTPWRNGSASDSRSEGCVFESRRGQNHFPFFWPSNLNWTLENFTRSWLFCYHQLSKLLFMQHFALLRRIVEHLLNFLICIFN